MAQQRVYASNAGSPAGLQETPQGCGRTAAEAPATRRRSCLGPVVSGMCSGCCRGIGWPAPPMGYPRSAWRSVPRVVSDRRPEECEVGDHRGPRARSLDRPVPAGIGVLAVTLGIGAGQQGRGGMNGPMSVEVIATVLTGGRRRDRGLANGRRLSIEHLRKTNPESARGRLGR